MEDSELRIPSALSQLRGVRAYVENKAFHLGFPEAEAQDIALSVHEALTNAFVHGHALDASKTVHLCFTVTAEFLQISLRDEGPGFDFSTVLHHRSRFQATDQLRGRGLLLIMRLMDEVWFEKGGREIFLRKIRPGKKGRKPLSLD